MSESNNLDRYGAPSVDIVDCSRRNVKPTRMGLLYRSVQRSVRIGVWSKPIGILKKYGRVFNFYAKMINLQKCEARKTHAKKRG